MKIYNLMIASIFVFSTQARADVFTDTFGEEPLSRGEVIVERPTNLTGSYKERRGVHGVLFSVNYEKYRPINYTSQFENTGYVEDIIGNDKITLTNAELGYKFNFSLGSIGLLLGYGFGKSPDNEANKSSVKRLEATRTVFAASFALDNYFEEPWVVPYAQGGVYNMSINEFQGELSKSESSGYALSYKAGLLFQLNWIEGAIDPSTQIDGRRSTGLQNTFLDVYYVEHTPAAGAKESHIANAKGAINTDSTGEVGLGLKLEF